MFHRMGRPMSPPIQHNDNKNHFRLIYIKHKSIPSQQLTHYQELPVRQSFKTSSIGMPVAKYICFGDALGQNVKSAPRYLPVARRHQKNLFSSYLHLTPFDISPR